MTADNRKPGYGVLGLGVGMAHAEAAFASENADLIAVCDLKQERLDAAAEEFPGVRTYTDFEQFLADPDIDIISVCLPSGMHADYAIRCLEAGKHVLVEKPVDISVDAAERLIAASERSGRKCGVCLQNRNNLSMRPFREAIDSGRIGQILFGTFAVKWMRPQSYFDETDWRGTWSMDGGGSLINQSTHTVDLMQWFMGDVVSVTSTMSTYCHDIETEDFTASLIKFKSGATATFLSTTCAYPGLATEICLYGTGGSLEADADRLLTYRMKDAPDAELEEMDMLEKYGHGNASGEGFFGHVSMVEDMISAVRNGHDPQVSPAEALKSLRIIRAVYESARTGKTVYLQNN